MDWENKVLKVGTAAVVCALVFRLLSGGLWQRAVAFLSRPETAAFLLYLETGRVVRPAELRQETEETTLPPETQPTTEAATLPPPPPPTQPAAVFSPEDAQAVEVGNVCGYPVDIPAMLTQSLQWDLKGEATVLILHSHGSECYTEPAFSDNGYRSTDTQYNVISIGDALAEQLEAAGIGVIHDRTLHDQPSYNSAYENAREAIRENLSAHPSIRLVLDLHRDAAEGSNGQQLAKSITVDGQQVAQLMLVVGSDAGGLSHPEWEENMALAVKLHATLEQLCPGICRPISFRTQRFNQDLSPGALIVEVGAAGNTRQEALRAAKILAQAIEHLSQGTAMS